MEVETKRRKAPASAHAAPPRNRFTALADDPEEKQDPAEADTTDMFSPAKWRADDENTSKDVGYDQATFKQLRQQKYEELDEDHLEAYLFMKIMKIPSNRPQRPFCIPRKTSKKPTLVLDLDETLVHCSVEPIANPYRIFTVRFNSVDYKVYMRKRPFYEEFMKVAERLFEVVIFTASQQVYAERVLKIIDPHKKYISSQCFRDSCYVLDGNYLKDLTILGRDLKTTAIIDNSPQAFTMQVNNGIPIRSWFEDDNDRELLNMIPLLEELAKAKDFRPFLEKKFQLKKLIAEMDVEELIRSGAIAYSDDLC